MKTRSRSSGKTHQRSPYTSRSSKKSKSQTSVPISSDASDGSDSSFSFLQKDPHSPASESPPSQPDPPTNLVNPFSTASELPDNFFRGQSFEARFKNSIATKQFVYEKFLDLFYLKNSSLEKLFMSCGISAMLSPPTKAYPRLIQQFYTNLECNGDCYTTFVKGKSMFFTVIDFASIFSISSSGPCPFTLKGAANIPFPPLEQLHTVMDDTSLTTLFTPKTVDVCPLACVLHKILRYNLFPRIGGGGDFTYQDLVVIAMILKGVTFNFSLMMLSHMMSCIRQTKKCLPYGLFLTKLFQHFKICLDEEIVVSHNEFIDSASLKQSHLSFVDGSFVRLTPDPIPPPNVISSVLPTDNSASSSHPPSSVSSPIVVDMLSQILKNQDIIRSDIVDIKQRISVLEKQDLPIRPNDISKCFSKFEDEFIDLQAGFEMHTMAMVESLHRKINRNSCQLSQELKFVSHQVGEFADFMAHRLNDVGKKLHFTSMHSPVPEWPRCNWMAEYIGDFLDLPLPNETFIPRPPKFAHDFSMEERIHRVLHRPYFTNRPLPKIHIDDIDI